MLALTGIGLNVYQQARAAHEAKSDRQDAVSQTSSEVSARVSESVSKSLSGQYQGTINTLQSQIATLQSRLDAQAKKVDIIGNSDIVTGKKPIPVVVQNQPPAPPTEEPLKIYASQMPVEPNTKYGAFARQYILTTNKVMNGAHAIVTCKGTITDGNATISGAGVVIGGGSKTDDHTFSIGIETPNWSPSSPLVVTLYYDDASTIGSCKIRLQQ